MSRLNVMCGAKDDLRPLSITPEIENILSQGAEDAVEVGTNRSLLFLIITCSYIAV